MSDLPKEQQLYYLIQDSPPIMILTMFCLVLRMDNGPMIIHLNRYNYEQLKNSLDDYKRNVDQKFTYETNNNDVIEEDWIRIKWNAFLFEFIKES